MSINIALDAMGGDHAPGEIIRGALIAAEANPELKILLIGDENIIREELRNMNLSLPFEIMHTDEWIGMDEDPKEAVEKKLKASINIACQLVNEGVMDGLVSAGNTGATILSAAKNIPVIKIAIIFWVLFLALLCIYPLKKNSSTIPIKIVKNPDTIDLFLFVIN